MKIHHKEKLNRKEIIDMTEKLFLEAEDIAEIFHISRGKAYVIIKQLNEELKEQGYIVIRGKVNSKYFFKKLVYAEE